MLAPLLTDSIGLSTTECGCYLDIQIVTNNSNTLVQILRAVTVVPVGK